MHRKDEQEQQWQDTLEVAAELKNRPAPKVGALPRPGELYLSRRTADFPVEWLVLEAAAGGRLRLVPVDDYPLAGSCDVELPAPSLGGVAVARCGLEAWAAGSALEAELRTGVLREVDLEQVLGKRKAVEKGGVEPSLLEEVVDGDLEYQRWVEGTLRPAVEALETPPVVVPIWTRRLTKTARSWGPALAVAAILVMVLALGWSVQRLGEQLADAGARVAELEERGAEQVARIEEEARLRELSNNEASRLGGLLGSAEAALAERGTQLDAVHRKLLQALDIGAAVNPRKLVFGGKARFGRSGERGEAVVMQAGSSELAFLEVEVVDAEPYLTYRLRIVPKKGGKALVVEGLSRDGAWLRLGLSAEKLGVGEYLVLIDGMGFGEAVELDERYRLTVEP